MTTLTASDNVGGGGICGGVNSSSSSRSGSYLHHNRRRYATPINRRKQRLLRRTQSDHHEEENGHSDVDGRYHRAVAFMQHFRHSHSLDVVDEDSPLGEKQRTMKRSETASCLQSLGSLEEQSHEQHHDYPYSFSTPTSKTIASSNRHNIIMMAMTPSTPAIVEYDECDVVMVQMNDGPSFQSTR